MFAYWSYDECSYKRETKMNKGATVVKTQATQRQQSRLLSYLEWETCVLEMNKERGPGKLITMLKYCLRVALATTTGRKREWQQCPGDLPLVLNAQDF